MRISRVQRFKRLRGRKLRSRIVYGALLPFASIFLGYLITTLVILPSMKK